MDLGGEVVRSTKPKVCGCIALDTVKPTYLSVSLATTASVVDYKYRDSNDGRIYSGRVGHDITVELLLTLCCVRLTSTS